MSAGGGALAPVASGVGVRLPGSLAGQPVSVTASGVTAGLTLQGATAAPASTARDTATYRQVLPGADVEWQAISSGVKDTIALSGPQSTSTYSYRLSLTPGATASTGPGGSVLVRDAAGANSLRVSPPTVQDAAPGSAPQVLPVRMSLAGAGDGATLTVTVDPAWLADPARVFPVRVDPQITDATSSATEIRSTATSTNYYPASSVCLSSTQRGLLSFADIGTLLPRDSEVRSASVQVFGVPGAAFSTITAAPLAAPFDPGTATWNQSRAGTPWASPGGDVSSAMAAVTSTNPGTTAPYVPVDTLAQGWLDGTTAQNGFLLQTAGSSGCWQTTGANAPQLIVYYSARLGLATGRFFDHAIDDRLTAHVNLASGNLVLQATDLATPSAGKGLRVVRTYNSRAVMSPSDVIGYTGQGWTTDPFDRYQNRRISPDGEVQVMTPVPGSNSKMLTGPPGSDLSETVSSVNGGTVDTYLHGRSQERETYDYQGTYFLSQARLTDRNGNATTVSYGADPEYGAYPTGITDSQGRSYSFPGIGCGCGTVDKIVGPDPSGTGTRTVAAYTHNGTGDLTSATDTAGKTTTYTYDSAHRMTSVTTPGGREAVFTYDTAARVTSLTYVASPASCTPGNPASCPGSTTLFDYVQPTVTGGGGMTANPDGSLPAGPAGTTGLTRVIDADATGVSTGAAPSTTGNGHYTDYTWTSRDLVMKVTDANGRSRPSTYGADDNLLTTADATGTGGTGSGGQGNVTRYGFGAKPYYNPTSSQAPTGAMSAASYNLPAGGNAPGYQQQPDSSTDAQGAVTTYGYDSTAGNLTQTMQKSRTGTMMSTSAAAYQGIAGTSCRARPGSVCTTTTSRDGTAQATTSYSYDCATTGCATGQGNLLSVTPPAGSGLGTTTYSYDAVSQPVDVVDGRGQHTRTTYDPDGRATTVALYDTLGNLAHTVTNSCDPDGFLTGRTDTAGSTSSTISYGTDAYGRATAKLDPGAGAISCSDADNPADYSGAQTGQQYRYDPAGNLRSSCDSGGTSIYRYDKVNQLASYTDAVSGHSCTGYNLTGPLPPASAECTLFGYDANGARTLTRYASGVTQAAQYDGTGRTTRICGLAAGSTPIDPTTLGQAGNPGSCDTSTLPQLTYDAYSYAPAPGTGLPASNGDSQITQARQTSGVGKPLARLDYTYDGANRLTGSDAYPNAVLGRTLPGARPAQLPAPAAYWRLDDPDGSTTATDSSGNGLTATGSGVSHGPGALSGGDTAAQLNGGSSYTVNDDARLRNAGSFTDTAWVSPNASGIVMGHGLPNTGGYGWALSVTPSSVTYQHGAGTGTGPSVSAAVPGTVTGWRHIVVTGDGSTIRIYVNGALIGSGAKRWPDDTDAQSFFLGSGYNGNGKVSGGLDEAAVYTSTLSAPDISRIYAAASYGTSYSYDNDGNRLAQNDTTTLSNTGSITAYTAYNDADTPCWRSTTAGTSCTGAPPSGAQTIGSDTNGNLVNSLGALNASPSLPALTLSYGAGDTTSTITPASGSSQAQTYAGLGQNERTSSGGITSTNGFLGVTADTANGTNAYDRTPDGQLLRLRTTRTTDGSAGTYNYLADGQGSVTAVTDAAGNVTDHYTYDPYGVTVGATSGEALAQPWQYVGGYHDSSSGLYKLGVRFYATSFGAFTQRDPTGADAYSYSYANDNPLDGADSNGAQTNTLVAVAAGAATSSAVQGFARAAGPAGVLAGAAAGCVGGAVTAGVGGDTSAGGLASGCLKGAIGGVIGPAGKAVGSAARTAVDATGKAAKAVGSFVKGLF
jgi:RHS repeat-associated protein